MRVCERGREIMCVCERERECSLCVRVRGGENVCMPVCVCM